MSLLRYEDLCISFGSGRREKFAVNHLDLEVGIGERVALVGESGSGKTLTALAPLRLEPEGAKVSGKIYKLHFKIIIKIKMKQEKILKIFSLFQIFIKFITIIINSLTRIIAITFILTANCTSRIVIILTQSPPALLD